MLFTAGSEKKVHPDPNCWAHVTGDLFDQGSVYYRPLLRSDQKNVGRAFSLLRFVLWPSDIPEHLE